MLRICLVLLGVMAVCAAPALRAVDPIPESKQAALAMKIIDAYHGMRPETPPKKLYIAYYTPAGREPAAGYEPRLRAIMEDIRSFYGDGMQRLGFGPKTFAMECDSEGKAIIHLVKGTLPEEAFPGWEGRNGGNTGSPLGGERVKNECRPSLEAAGISFERETVLIFCHLAAYDEKTRRFRHHSPYFGRWTQQSGLCFAADWAEQDLASLTRKEPMLNDAEFGEMSLGKHTTVFMGGIAHELGHAFALPHCGERWDEKALGTSLMGAGNHTYREEQRGEGKGSFLTMASAMRLASRPVFNGSDKNETEKPRLESGIVNLLPTVTRADLAGRRGTLRVEGNVQGTPPIYGVLAYFDSQNDDGYRSPTATSVPDAQGRFAMEVSDLAPCENGGLRIEFCHANGSVSEQHLGFTATPEGSVNFAEWKLRKALGPVADAVSRNHLAGAEEALRKLEAGDTSELAKNVARKLVATLRGEPKSNPAEAPPGIIELPLGDALAQDAEVGWLAPAANRVPLNEQIQSPWLESGKIYATGLFAHAPSRYVYDLGGKWKWLRGEAGLHTAQQSYGSVEFIVKADGREVFHSKVIRGKARPAYEIDLTNVKTLELIVGDAGDGNGNDWGLWLDPTLFREPPAESPEKE